MKMKAMDLDKVLEGFDPNTPAHETVRSGGPVTIWLPRGFKARYDKLQEVSKGRGRRFSDVSREALMKLIELAETRAS
jgi:hypothetical protein